MIRVKEVYQEAAKYEASDKSFGQPQMRMRKVYVLRDCLLNPDYVVAVYPHSFDSSVDQDMLSDNFSDTHEFSRVILDGNSFRSSEIIINVAYDKLAEQLT